MISISLYNSVCSQIQQIFLLYLSIDGRSHLISSCEGISSRDNVTILPSVSGIWLRYGHRAEKVHRKNGQNESVRIERGKLYGEM